MRVTWQCSWAMLRTLSRQDRQKVSTGHGSFSFGWWLRFVRERASRRRWIVLSVHDQNVVLLDRGGELLIMGGS